MQKAIRIIFAAAIFAASAQALKVDIELGNRATKANKAFKAPLGPAFNPGPSAAKVMEATINTPSWPVG